MQTNINDIRQFIQFAARELKLTSQPVVKFVGSSENLSDFNGYTRGNTLTVRVTDRHPIDIMKSIAYELIRYRSINSRVREDQASTVVNKIMGKFDKTHPMVFRDKSIRANMLFEEMTTAGIAPAAVNATGPGITGYDKMLGSATCKTTLLKRRGSVYGSVKRSRKGPR
jgi:hypothetical protein